MWSGEGSIVFYLNPAIKADLKAGLDDDPIRFTFWSNESEEKDWWDMDAFELRLWLLDRLYKRSVI